MKKAVYPGTFDPITNGHMDIIKRSSEIFGGLLIAVVNDNSLKNVVFNANDRLKMIEDAIKISDLKNVKCVIFEGLLVDFAKQNGCGVIVRGLRAVSDFEYELQMASMNSELCADVETLFLPTRHDLHFISATFIKSIARLNGDVSKMVPTNVAEKLRRFYS